MATADKKLKYSVEQRRITTAGVERRLNYSDVLVFIPNLIGYTRVFLTFAAYYFALPSDQPFLYSETFFSVKLKEHTGWKITVACYSISFILDAVDGIAARRFKQASNFGAVLDMVTDRCSTAGLFMILALLYKKYAQMFIFLMVLDISSHWFQMKMTVAGGHHKQGNSNPIIKCFYEVYWFFGYCCVGTEFMYIALYTLKFYPDPTLTLLTTFVLAPACVLKNFINVCQLCSASAAIAQRDAQKAGSYVL